VSGYCPVSGKAACSTHRLAGVIGPGGKSAYLVQSIAVGYALTCVLQARTPLFVVFGYAREHT